MFDEFDKVAKSDVFLYNYNFSITVDNPNETLDKFFTKFILVIAPLDFIDCNKITNFQKTRSDHLHY